jgi:hypothetical protein
MKLLALERELRREPEADYGELLRGEALRVWELVQEGVIREHYFRGDRHTAVLILECDDEHAARDRLATLPLVQAGYISFDVIPLVPYSGFTKLFADPGD